MQPPGSTDARYAELVGAFGRQVPDQEDLWLHVLEAWRLTVDQWEQLPWWQQRVYLSAYNRRAAAEKTKAEQQAAQTPSSPRGKVAGRKGPRPAGRSGDEQRPRAAGGRQKLRDSHLWERRKQMPPSLPRMTGQRPAPRSPPSS